MVANVPDSDPRTPSRNFTHRAYQLVLEPESAVTIALVGSRSESSQAMRIGLVGVADNVLWRSMVSHHRDTFFSMVSRQDRSSLRRNRGISWVRAAAESATMLTSVGY